MFQLLFSAEDETRRNKSTKIYIITYGIKASKFYHPFTVNERLAIIKIKENKKHILKAFLYQYDESVMLFEHVFLRPGR